MPNSLHAGLFSGLTRSERALLVGRFQHCWAAAHPATDDTATLTPFVTITAKALCCSANNIRALYRLFTDIGEAPLHQIVGTSLDKTVPLLELAKLTAKQQSACIAEALRVKEAAVASRSVADQATAPERDPPLARPDSAEARTAPVAPEPALNDPIMGTVMIPLRDIADAVRPLGIGAPALVAILSAHAPDLASRGPWKPPVPADAAALTRAQADFLVAHMGSADATRIGAARIAQWFAAQSRDRDATLGLPGHELEPVVRSLDSGTPVMSSLDLARALHCAHDAVLAIIYVDADTLPRPHAPDDTHGVDLTLQQVTLLASHLCADSGMGRVLSAIVRFYETLPATTSVPNTAGARGRPAATSHAPVAATAPSMAVSAKDIAEALAQVRALHADCVRSAQSARESATQARRRLKPVPDDLIG
ncbi:MAG TPA: hypothetical protein VF292_02730 [Rhodanobacteraceae bacterium]